MQEKIGNGSYDKSIKGSIHNSLKKTCSRIKDLFKSKNDGDDRLAHQQKLDRAEEEREKIRKDKINKELQDGKRINEERIDTLLSGENKISRLQENNIKNILSRLVKIKGIDYVKENIGYDIDIGSHNPSFVGSVLAASINDIGHEYDEISDEEFLKAFSKAESEKVIFTSPDSLQTDNKGKFGYIKTGLNLKKGDVNVDDDDLDEIQGFFMNKQLLCIIKTLDGKSIALVDEDIIRKIGVAITSATEGKIYKNVDKVILLDDIHIDSIGYDVNRVFKNNFPKENYINIK